MNLFSKRKKIDSPVFPIKTDIHSHVLPGLDDGAKNTEESIEILNAFIEHGYKKIITTPHVASERYNNSPETIKTAYFELLDTVKKLNLDITIEYAAEYFAENSFLELIDSEQILCFGTNYVLLEFSFLFPPVAPDVFANKLKEAGYIPVLAHPERYQYWTGKKSVFENLRKEGYLFQSNLNSAAGNYGYSAKKTFQLLSDNRMIDFLGTDAHYEEAVHQSAKALKLKSVQQTNINWLLNNQL